MLRRTNKGGLRYHDNQILDGALSELFRRTHQLPYLGRYSHSLVVQWIE